MQEPQQPQQPTQQQQTQANTPPPTAPQRNYLVHIISITLVGIGILSGLLASRFYTGLFLPSFVGPKRSEFFKNDRVVPPGIGYNYIHNLGAFPEEIFSFSSQVQKIRIVGGRISTIPPKIAQLSNINTLEISNNNLKEVSPEIGSLANLQILILGGNDLNTIPPEVGNLTLLEELYLHDNNLESLPSEIGNLTNLRVLDLHLNSLTSIPDTIGNLRNLEVIYLGGNPLAQEDVTRLQNQLPETKVHF